MTELERCPAFGVECQYVTEVERLREALELADAALRGANMNMNVVQRKIRTALGDHHERH